MGWMEAQLSKSNRARDENYHALIFILHVSFLVYVYSHLLPTNWTKQYFIRDHLEEMI